MSDRPGALAAVVWLAISVVWFAIAVWAVSVGGLLGLWPLIPVLVAC